MHIVNCVDVIWLELRLHLRRIEVAKRRVIVSHDAVVQVDFVNGL